MSIFFTSNTMFLGGTKADTDLSVISWNSQVSPEDSVYAVGNFIDTENLAAAVDVVNSLNGKIFLVFGPRDHRDVLKYLERRVNEFRLDDEKLHIVGPYYTLSGTRSGLKDKVILSYWPLARWEMQEHGAWHVHGGEFAGYMDRRGSADWKDHGRRFLRVHQDKWILVNVPKLPEQTDFNVVQSISTMAE